MKCLSLLALLLALFCAGPALADDSTNHECKYFSVTLPDDWKAVSEPKEHLASGLATAHFARQNGTSAVLLMAGPAGGMDAKSIASTFAEQYKAKKEPVESNGGYNFSFSQQKIACQAWVAVQDDVFMFMTFMGNQRDGQLFVRKHVKSADYGKLLPR